MSVLERARSTVAGSYERLPSIAQDLVISAYGAQEIVRRRGAAGPARRRVAEIDALHFDADLAAREIERRLRHVLDVARRLPGYHHAPLPRPDPIDELASWPIITKADVRGGIERFLVRATTSTDISTLTSGTSGTPLKVWRPRSAFREVFLSGDAFKGWYGVPPAARRASFTGRVVVPRSSRRVWRLDVPGKRMVLSQYHLGRREIDDYAAALRWFRPRILDGYTSNLVDLAELLLEAGHRIEVDLVVPSAEVLTPGGRAVMEEAFGGRVADKYGSSENVVIAYECPSGARHLFPNVGLLEVVDDDGAAVDPGEPGRLLLTTLTNDLMPLVRYEVGDRGIVSEGRCACGRTTPILAEVLGREDDVVVTRDGRRIAILAFNLLRGQVGVVAMQLVQESFDRFVVRAHLVDGTPTRIAEFEAAILAAFDRMVGPDPARTVVFAHGAAIERTPGGKVRNVIRAF